MPYPAKTSPEDIRDAALKLLEQQGLAALSMRTLAEGLGLSASSLYRHYADRPALEQALADEAARRLHAAMEQARVTAGAQTALKAAGEAYLSFAREHAELYSLLHAPRPPVAAKPGPQKDLWNLLLQLVESLTGRHDDTSAAVAVWAYLHGYVSLERSGLLGLSGPQGGFERGLHALLLGLAGKHP